MIPIIYNPTSKEVPDVPINWFAVVLMLIAFLFIFGGCCFCSQWLLRDKKQDEERGILLQEMEPTAEREEPEEENTFETVEEPTNILDLP